MAYNKKNRLKRIIDIQEIYLDKQSQGVNPMNIYRLYVYPAYKISESCFFKYLAINAKKELKDIETVDSAQLSIF